jgi:predicted O-methyltransferase YrrM
MRSLQRFFSRQPRALNILHRLRLVRPASQTNEEELVALGKYAAGTHIALEIGSFQGVSAAIIASSMDRGGVLYCVDPWPELVKKANSCLAIFQRHIRRQGLQQKIRVLRGFSGDVSNDVPSNLDFVFVDGDHSADGIAVDWAIVKRKLRSGGVICLHDVYVPPLEPWRRLGSTCFFETIIQCDPEFSVIDRIHSMAVLRRMSACSEQISE